MFKLLAVVIMVIEIIFFYSYKKNDFDFLKLELI